MFLILRSKETCHLPTCCETIIIRSKAKGGSITAPTKKRRKPVSTTSKRLVVAIDLAHTFAVTVERDLMASHEELSRDMMSDQPTRYCDVTFVRIVAQEVVMMMLIARLQATLSGRTTVRTPFWTPH